MAMTTCRECGGAVSEAAEKCPHCGVMAPSQALAERIARRQGDVLRVTLGLLLLLAIAGGLFLFAGSRNSEDERPAPNVTATEAAEIARDTCEKTARKPMTAAQASDATFTWPSTQQSGGVGSWNVTGVAESQGVRRQFGCQVAYLSGTWVALGFGWDDGRLGWP